MHPKLLLPVEDPLSQFKNVFRRNLLDWRASSIRNEVTAGKESTVNEFVSLFEESPRVLERTLESGKATRVQSADKPLRIGELATDLPRRVRALLKTV